METDKKQWIVKCEMTRSEPWRSDSKTRYRAVSLAVVLAKKAHNKKVWIERV